MTDFNLREESGELQHVIGVDTHDLFDQFRIAAMMRDGVMSVGDPDFAVRPRAAFAAEHDSCDARRAGLERGGQKVEHQLGIIAEIGGNAGRFFDRRRRLPLGFPRSGCGVRFRARRSGIRRFFRGPAAPSLAFNCRASSKT